MKNVNDAGLADEDEYSRVDAIDMVLMKSGLFSSSTDLSSADVKLVRAMMTDEKNWFLKPTHLTRCVSSSSSSPLSLRLSTSPPANW